MSLFQPSVLKKYLNQQDTAVVQKAYKKCTKYFHNAAIQENIRNSKEEQFEWLDLFEENKTKAQTLQLHIETTEKTIDKMVYESYGLSEEEIAIVESSNYKRNVFGNARTPKKQ